MVDTTARMYTLLDDVHFENIERYRPTDEYSSVARNLLPADWQLQPRGFWTHCRPPGWKSRSHGWKIHISSIPENAEETIAVACEEIAAAGAMFKFCSDPRMLAMSLGKGWSRFQLGKFITLYPAGEAQFLSLLERLHVRTQHLGGPHILTDRPYKGSSVVYYRYGAHSEGFRPDIYGNRQQGFRLEDGSWHDDVRGAHFRLPPGCTDPVVPLERPAVDPPPAEILLNQRYRVLGALKFNGTGGVYHGVDMDTGQRIVIREVRGFAGSMQALAPHVLVGGIQREARILQKLSGTGLVPEFVALFKEWNNWFLVEEQLEASTLWDSAMDFYFSEELQTAADGFRRIREKIVSIAEALSVVHSRGVVLRDLTRSNVMFTAAGKVKFIDLEFAHEIGVDDRWVKGWTPGYASAEQRASRRPTVQEDHYALGVLILDMLTFCASGLDLARGQIVDGKLPQVLADLGLPEALRDIVVGLTDQDAGRRWDIAKTLKALGNIEVPSLRRVMFPSRQELLTAPVPAPSECRALQDILSGLAAYLHSAVDTGRDDRLWPAGPQLFFTNPVSLQFGATGTAWFLLRHEGHLDPAILDWIQDRAVSERCPPGLYSGLAGVSLLLLQAGRREAAMRVRAGVAQSGDALATPSLYFGAAGQGLMDLHFWQATGDGAYLSSAISIGEGLLESSRRSPQGRFWSSQGKVFLGLGDGQSGIALFLSYLGVASGDARFLEAASQALDYDISHGIRVAGRLFWKNLADAPANASNSPHTRFGAAGIGTACLRHFAATGEVRFREIALECAYSVRSRVTNKLWQESGNAGFGEYMLDLACVLGDERYANVAFHHAEAIVQHAVPMPVGVAFAGPAHHRVCNEYSVGGAGIGIFLDRLLKRSPRLLMLDGLLDRRSGAARRLA
ncbi:MULTISPECIES: protein kinase domain-containing protein [Stenotrophomonas maltophilia group]|uniref:class III lanthionine synthetase LanKC N-terminal domain-containing protein n=1 Tax=Stenotrophomonas maltophilia group TaxID=995085 RepID=UPI0006A82A68|nr:MULTISPECIES: lanthionine synthetase LanC family protein [Stenotrophomonas maltophilia group]MCO5737188.1 protein kinase/lanthionine synthetase C family protein [Stenotrophomonas maltophilia]MCZ7842515.1 protein kinase/lanthionine synthetase C family protein [Stenotrophomonas maltophilia]MDJ1625281.1 lanthionine synthetase LanC family protein [Stenotrophomonas sepilia]MDT3489767.1 lanthionine synthetase LanC family protein [Stenotrophomonas maltophilia group sp. msm4]CRX67349.1 unnamed prot